MFDSPFEFCTVCRQYVLLDQTHRQCAREHACNDASRCPLVRFFTGIEFDGARDAARHRGREKRVRTGEK
jgi:hypothetical protein